MKRLTVAFVVLASLGCGGLLVSGSGVRMTEDALRVVSPEMAFPLYVAGMSESRAPNPICARAVEVIPRASPDMRRPLVAHLLFEAPSCPRSCAADAVQALAAAPPTQAVAIAVAACGPVDPLGGPLAPLRDASDALDYLLFRMLWDAAPMDEALLPSLGVSLALAGPRREQDTTQLVVSGPGVDKAAVAALEEAVRACAEAMDLRVVSGPGGVFVEGSPCTAELLRGLGLAPTPTWTVTDLTWSP